MDPTHLADEALRRFTALHATRSGEGSHDASDLRDSAAEALMAAFHHLAKLDGWAKIAMDRLIADPQDARAAGELRLSLEQIAGLHPQFMRRLADALVERPAAANGIAGTALPQQVAAGNLTSSDNRARR
jgi:hypothetical protein